MRWVAVSAAALLLAGCAIQPPPTALTDAEKQQYANATDAGWGTAIAGCMSAAGYEGYVGDGDDLQYPTADGGVSQSQTDAFYGCVARYPEPVDYSNYASLDQLDYLYDYFRDELIPCLAAEGYPVSGDVPSRQDFVRIQTESRWHPYDAVPADALSNPVLLERCPPSPFGDEKVLY